MKPLALLLAGSLTVNLAALVLGPAPRPREVASVTRELANPNGDGAADRRALDGKPAPVPPSLWATLHSADLATLVSQLRAAGFPPRVIHEIVNDEIDARFAPRRAEIARQIEAIPPWRLDFGTGTAGTTNGVIRAEMRKMGREATAVMKAALGHEALAGETATPAQRRQFGDLPRARIELIQRVNQDYFDMMQDVRADIGDITLPVDREKFAYLERERLADIAALLSPGEMQEYERRSSLLTMAGDLRRPLTLMDATEAEFHTISAIHRQYAAQLGTWTEVPGIGGFSLGRSFSTRTREQEQQVQAELAARLQAALGEQRYREFTRASDREYQEVHQIVQRQNLPVETAAQVYDLRHEASAAADAIDHAVPPLPDRRAAFQQLTQRLNERAKALLGEAGPSYLASTQWIQYLNSGTPVYFLPGGGITNIRPAALADPARVPTPPAP